MTINQLTEGNRILNRIDELKGNGFYRLPDYKKAVESMHRITIYYDGNHIDLTINDSLKDFFSHYLTNIENERAKEIQELELKLSQL